MWIKLGGYEHQLIEIKTFEIKLYLVKKMQIWKKFQHLLDSNLRPIVLKSTTYRTECYGIIENTLYF
jgi:hypothetical protein